MLEDIKLNPDPSYGCLILSCCLTIPSAMLVRLVFSYIRSKPSGQTIMDFITKFFMALLLGSCLVLTAFIAIMTFLSDSGETIAWSASLFLFNLGQTARLESLTIVALQVLCTQYPWLLDSSAFEKVYKLIVAIFMPMASISLLIVYCHLEHNDNRCFPEWYNILRGQDASAPQEDVGGAKFIFRVVSILLVIISSTLARLFIRMRYPAGHSPNYIIRHDILSFFIFASLVVNVLAPLQYFPITIVTIISLIFLMTSVAHSGVRNFALNRPLVRPFVTFYRTRLARRVTQSVNNPHTVII